MMRKRLMFLWFVFLLSSGNVLGQEKYAKAMLIGLPFPTGGIWFANAGFEYFDKEHSSWQAGISSRYNQLGADASTHTRTWLTIDRSYYLNSQKHPRKGIFISLFIEAGKRKTRPGDVYNNSDTIINHWNATDICPGIAGGKNFSIGRNWHLLVLAGPKAVLAYNNDIYLRKSSNSFYNIKYKELYLGTRFLVNLCYQL